MICTFRLLSTSENYQNNIYYYQFFHRGSFSFSDIFGNTQWNAVSGMVAKMFGRHESNQLGVCHADDCLYLLR